MPAHPNVNQPNRTSTSPTERRRHPTATRPPPSGTTGSGTTGSRTTGSGPPAYSQLTGASGTTPSMKYASTVSVTQLLAPL